MNAYVCTVLERSLLLDLTGTNCKGNDSLLHVEIFMYSTTQHSWRYDGEFNGMPSVISYLRNCEIYIRSYGPTMTLQIYISLN